MTERHGNTETYAVADDDYSWLEESNALVTQAQVAGKKEKVADTHKLEWARGCLTVTGLSLLALLATPAGWETVKLAIVAKLLQIKDNSSEESEFQLKDFIKAGINSRPSESAGALLRELKESKNPATAEGMSGLSDFEKRVLLDLLERSKLESKGLSKSSETPPPWYLSSLSKDKAEKWRRLTSQERYSTRTPLLLELVPELDSRLKKEIRNYLTILNQDKVLFTRVPPEILVEILQREFPLMLIPEFKDHKAKLIKHITTLAEGEFQRLLKDKTLLVEELSRYLLVPGARRSILEEFDMDEPAERVIREELTKFMAFYVTTIVNNKHEKLEQVIQDLTCGAVQPTQCPEARRIIEDTVRDFFSLYNVSTAPLITGFLQTIYNFDLKGFINFLNEPSKITHEAFQKVKIGLFIIQILKVLNDFYAHGKEVDAIYVRQRIIEQIRDRILRVGEMSTPVEYDFSLVVNGKTYPVKVVFPLPKSIHSSTLKSLRKSENISTITDRVRLSVVVQELTLDDPSFEEIMVMIVHFLKARLKNVNFEEYSDLNKWTFGKKVNLLSVDDSGFLKLILHATMHRQLCRTSMPVEVQIVCGKGLTGHEQYKEAQAKFLTERHGLHLTLADFFMNILNFLNCKLSEVDLAILERKGENHSFVQILRILCNIILNSENEVTVQRIQSSLRVDNTLDSGGKIQEIKELFDRILKNLNVPVVTDYRERLDQVIAVLSSESDV